MAVVVLAGLLGPLVSPWSPTATDLTAVRTGPSAAHWLGTDQLGRDELTRLLVAARTSLLAVAAVTALALPLGLALGALAGWRGGLVDALVLRVTDVTVALPALLTGLVLSSVLGAGLGGVVLALASGSWAAYARLVRTEVRLLRDQPAVQALVLLGARPPRILFRHVLPAVLGSVLVLTSTQVATTVLAISTLTFLGLGVRPPTPEWGSMIVEARPFLASDPHLFLLPTLAVGVVVLAVNVLAEDAGRWVTHGASSTPRRPAPAAVSAPAAVPAPGAGPRTATGAELLVVRDLVVELSGPAGRRRVVDGLDLTLDRGQVLAVVGSSGSGKSITAHALLGLLPEGVGAVARGSVRIAGREVLGRSDRELRRLRGGQVALVPQDLAAALHPLRRVGAQVAQAARLHRSMSRREADRTARELLGWVGLTDVDRVVRLRPDELSGGMRQRVLIAAALAGRPDLLVADEPTSALDSTVARQVRQLLARVRDELGTAVLVVTHDLAAVAGWADTVAVVDAGRVVECGPTGQLLQRPRHPATWALVAATRPVAPPPVTPAGGAPLLRATGVSVVYPRRGLRGHPRPALADVSLDLPVAGAVGLVGESGSGKSTLSRVLVGLQQPTGGTVELAGRPPVPREGRAQLVFQDPSAALDRRQTVGSALAEALELARRRGLPATGDVHRLLDRVGLGAEHADRRPWQLSGGQRQRVVIARSLAARPDVLVLDEPVSSLDAVVRVGVLQLLRALRQEGVALVVVSHDLAAVEALVDEVVVLHRGAVVERGPTAQVLRAPRHPVTAALVAAAHPARPTPEPPHAAVPADHRPGAAVPAGRPRERTTP
nr:ATP-binding cassette domain-containing protein [Modestobacter versicolor]